MRTWQFIALGWIGLALAGCRTDPAITMLERDNRIKEDEIFRLRDQVQDLEDALQASAMASAAKSTPSKKAIRTRSVAEPGPEPSPIDEGPAITAPRAPAKRAPSEPSQEPPEKPASEGPPPEAPATIKLPVIDIPKEPLPPGQIPERLKVPNRTGAPRPLRDQGSSSSPGPARARWNQGYGTQVSGAAVAAVDNARVAQITLNKALTGGIGRDERSGDENLLVVIEPRDVMGSILDAPGSINVALVDPATRGEAARIGRWDFTAAETAEMLSGGPDRGIHLTLPRPPGSPAHDRLQLFVRYATRDGRKFQVEQPIEIASAGGRPASWTRAESARNPEPAVSAETEPRSPVAAAPAAPAEPEPIRSASRPAVSESRRPLWSPERRYY